MQSHAIGDRHGPHVAMLMVYLFVQHKKFTGCTQKEGYGYDNLGKQRQCRCKRVTASVLQAWLGLKATTLAWLFVACGL